MMRTFVIALVALLALPKAALALNVFACEPEWGALATELGGDKVEVFTATTGLQDPHQIQARPALIARLRRADLAVCTGSELEIGWMPILLRQAANGRVQPGNPGWFEATTFVELKDKPARLDRAEGDIHPGGNPHIQTDPRNVAIVAAALTRRLIEIDGANAAVYRERGAGFQAKMQAAIARWQAEGAPLKGIGVIEYHKAWRYLLDWLDMRETLAIEPKPGVPPSSGYLAQLLAQIPARGPKMIVHAAYEDPRPSQFVAERSGLPAVQLPFTVGGNDAAKDLFALYDDTVRRLLEGLGARK
jgi:zinc/manganese transport system substrate-binding protein